MQVLGREGQGLAEKLVGQSGFASLLGRLIAAGKGCRVLDLTCDAARRGKALEKVGEKLLASVLLRQFEPAFLEIEDVYGSKIGEGTI